MPLGRRCPQCRGSLPEPLVESRPVRADDPDDHGDVEEDMCEEDGPDGPLDAVGQEGDERGRDDDGRQDERDEHECLDDGSTGEPEPRKGPRERQPGEQRQARRDGRLPEREPGDVAGHLAREDVEREVELAVDDEASLEDRGERPDEEDREKGQRRRDERSPAQAQRTTISVHRATQRSRFSSISSAGS